MWGWVERSETHPGRAQRGEERASLPDGRGNDAPQGPGQFRRGIIEGSYTQQEGQDLVTTLRSGALPAGITYLEDRTVGPSLGQDSIEASIKAGLLSMICVVLTLLVIYRLSGVNALIALGLNIVLLFGALAYFGATLTLPGIAGTVLSIAMAVDANVLIFERIREELAVGKTVRSAIDAGFGRAFGTILDSNLTTLIAALFLFQFGTGPVKGFAVTLSIGLTMSMFTAVFVVDSGRASPYLSRASFHRRGLSSFGQAATPHRRQWGRHEGSGGPARRNGRTQKVTEEEV